MKDVFNYWFNFFKMFAVSAAVPVAIYILLRFLGVLS